MSNIFARLFTIGQSSVHGILDKAENPIKMTEQGIRELKNDLQDTMQSLAQVKALAIRMARDGAEAKSSAEGYERKAMLLLQKGQSGDLEEAEGERLAREALERKEEATGKAAEFTQLAATQQNLADQLQSKLNELKSRVSSYENELVSLKARSKTANATRKINQQLNNVDSNSTVAMLERMKDRVNEQETLAEAYGDMAEQTTSIDDEINKALESGTSPGVDDSLAKLKAQLGPGKKEE